MNRELMLEHLGKSHPYFEDIEEIMLTEYPQVHMVLAGSRVEKSSFRFYYRKKFIAYLNVHDGYFDVMTRHTAEGIEEVDKSIGEMSDYAKEIWKNRYPCGTGAWIHYHVDSQATRDEAIFFLRLKADSIVKGRKGRK